MAANDVHIKLYRQDSAGIEQIEAVQKLDATDVSNLFDDSSIPTSKLANEAVTTAKIADNAITAAKVANVAAPTVVGTPAQPVVVEVEIANGSTDDVGSLVMPWKARLVGLSAVKTGGNGDATTSASVEDAAAGAGNTIAALSLNDTDQSVIQTSVIDDDHADLAEGATIYFRRTKISGNNACRLYVTFIKHA